MHWCLQCKQFHLQELPPYNLHFLIRSSKLYSTAAKVDLFDLTICTETWPDVDGQNFKEDWDKEGHIHHPKRSDTALTTEDIHQLQQDTPAHNELRAPMNQFMERQFANQEPLRNNLLIPTLKARINQAAKLRGALAQMVHAISRNFTIRDTNQIMEQLIIRCRGDLNVYIHNETLMHNHCMEIVGSLGLTMLDTMLSVDD